MEYGEGRHVGFRGSACLLYRSSNPSKYSLVSTLQRELVESAKLWQKLRGSLRLETRSWLCALITKINLIWVNYLNCWKTTWNRAIFLRNKHYPHSIRLSVSRTFRRNGFTDWHQIWWESGSCECSRIHSTSNLRGAGDLHIWKSFSTVPFSEPKTEIHARW